ncbi:hypothetical protein ACFV9C_25395 [Kribbella sp. NPDC059898]|uniref:hypothetical protein n=1 Tax=Kribbella sp. NPDC059898 TaxID=3346995 RepID=UPI00364AB186
MLALLREHGDVIEADLQHHYGVALTGVWTGQLTLRRLRVLLEHLPPDSATAHAVAGTDPGPLRGWTLTDALVGRLLDEMASYRWQWEMAHQSKGNRRRAPESVLPKLSTVAAGTDTPVVSPHSLGGFINFEEAE